MACQMPSLAGSCATVALQDGADQRRVDCDLSPPPERKAVSHDLDPPAVGSGDIKQPSGKSKQYDARRRCKAKKVCFKPFIRVSGSSALPAAQVVRRSVGSSPLVGPTCMGGVGCRAGPGKRRWRPGLQQLQQHQQQQQQQGRKKPSRGQARVSNGTAGTRKVSYQEARKLRACLPKLGASRGRHAAGAGGNGASAKTPMTGKAAPNSDIVFLCSFLAGGQCRQQHTQKVVGSRRERAIPEDEPRGLRVGDALAPALCVLGPPHAIRAAAPGLVGIGTRDACFPWRFSRPSPTRRWGGLRLHPATARSWTP